MRKHQSCSFITTLNPSITNLCPLKKNSSFYKIFMRNVLDVFYLFRHFVALFIPFVIFQSGFLFILLRPKWQVEPYVTLAK